MHFFLLWQPVPLASWLIKHLDLYSTPCCVLLLNYTVSVWYLIIFFCRNSFGNNYSTWAWNYFRVVYSDNFLTEISAEGEAQWILDSLRKLYLESLCGWRVFFQVKIWDFFFKEKNARKKKVSWLRILIWGY